MLNKTNTKQGERMKKCIICNDQPKEIWTHPFSNSFCKPCMEKHGDTHHDKVGVYPKNYIPSDYFHLINNKERA